jgi:type I restriction enzyme S subunit
MTNWKEYKLGDITTWKSGGTPSKQNEKFWNGNISWLSAKSFNSSRIYDSEIKITNEGLKNGSRLAPLNSILLLVRGSGLFNDIPIGIVRTPVAFNQDIKAIEVNEDIIKPTYLLYWLLANKPLLVNKLEFTGIGAGKFDTDTLKGLTICIPNISTQIIITEILSSIDDKIEINNQINENLETLAKSLFKQWFVDFEFPDNKGNPYKSSGGKMTESELGEIPSGWCFDKLEKHIKFVKGKKPKEVFNEQTDNLLPQILIETLDTGKSFFAEPVKMVISEETDLIMVMDGASSGRIETGFSGIIGSTLAIIKINKSINTFIYQFLKTKEKDIRDNTTGAAIPHTDKSKIYDFDIIMPTDNIVEGFNIIIEDIRKKVKSNKSENVKLTQLRDLLLPKLMSGELEVKAVKDQLTTV